MRIPDPRVEQKQRMSNLIDEALTIMGSWVPEVISFVLGGGSGMFLGYFISPKKDRDAKKQKDLENGREFLDDIDLACQSYTEALNAYDPERPTIEAFRRIANTGTRYFTALNTASSAILSELIDKNIKDGDLVKRIENAAQKTIPDHYRTMSRIAVGIGSEHPAIPDKGDYGSIYKIADASKHSS